MKAYQLKIMIKDSHPPIWRRVIVPGGITFSGLSVILNEVMNWSGSHPFAYHFKGGIQIYEAYDDLYAEDFSTCFLEASRTFINDYLDEYGSFTYIYDFGDFWEHKVAVEKILEDYGSNYAEVIKFKGNCPVEDCGGICGYYHSLKVLEDKNDPEYPEVLEWMELRGYPNVYNMPHVNTILKDLFFYKWGKRETRTYTEILADICSNKNGLRALKKLPPKKAPEEAPAQSERSGDFLLQYRNMLEKTFTKQTLTEMLSSLLKDELIGIGIEKGLRGLYKYNKKGVVSLLTADMLKPERAASYLYYMTDEAAAELEVALKSDKLYKPQKMEHFDILINGQYVQVIGGDYLAFPVELAKIYSMIKDSAFEAERKKRSFLLCCLRTGDRLYGIIPFGVLRAMLARNPKISMGNDEILFDIRQIPPDIEKFCIKGKAIYAEYIVDEEIDIPVVPENVGYYIPTLKEIMTYGTLAINRDYTAVKNLSAFFSKTYGMPVDAANMFCDMIQIQIESGMDIEGVLDMIDSWNLELYPSEAEKLDFLIKDMCENTRSFNYHGFTLRELKEKERKEKPGIEGGSNVIDFKRTK